MSLTIVTSHWKEDLTWLTRSKFPVVLIDKVGSDQSPLVAQHVVPNLGRECTSYLKYIIENYDNLPEAVAFIHGHETSKHQNHDRPLLEVIEGANWKKYGFIPINNMHVGEGFSNELFLDPEGLPVCSVRLYSLFDRLCIPLQGGRPLENGPWAHDLGAQFIVTRERIRANPRMLYEGWYHIFTTHSGFSDEFAWILERCWHTVFGEVAVHIPQKDWFSFEWFVKNGRGGDAPMWDWPQ